MTSDVKDTQTDELEPSPFVHFQLLVRYCLWCGWHPGPVNRSAPLKERAKGEHWCPIYPVICYFRFLSHNISLISAPVPQISFQIRPFLPKSALYLVWPLQISVTVGSLFFCLQTLHQLLIDITHYSRIFPLCSFRTYRHNLGHFIADSLHNKHENVSCRFVLCFMHRNTTLNFPINNNSVVLVRERIIPTDWPPKFWHR
jgi:hypothetical protein